MPGYAKNAVGGFAPTRIRCVGPRAPGARVHDVGNAIHRRAPAAACHARDLRRRAQLRAADVRDALGRGRPASDKRCARRTSIAGSPAAQRAGDRRAASRARPPGGRNRQRRADFAALVPRRVRRQDQCGDLAGRGQRRLHRRGAVRAHARGGVLVRTQCDTARASPSVSVVSGAIEAGGGRSRGRRRCSPSACSPGGRCACWRCRWRAGPAMQQRRRRLSRHARVAVGAARDHGFRQAQHAAHPRQPCRARRRNAFPRCRDWRSRYRRRSRAAYGPDSQRLSWSFALRQEQLVHLVGAPLRRTRRRPTSGSASCRRVQRLHRPPDLVHAVVEQVADQQVGDRAAQFG